MMIAPPTDITAILAATGSGSAPPADETAVTFANLLAVAVPSAKLSPENPEMPVAASNIFDAEPVSTANVTGGAEVPLGAHYANPKARVDIPDLTGGGAPPVRDDNEPARCADTGQPSTGQPALASVEPKAIDDKLAPDSPEGPSELPIDSVIILTVPVEPTKAELTVAPQAIVATHADRPHGRLREAGDPVVTARTAKAVAAPDLLRTEPARFEALDMPVLVASELRILTPGISRSATDMAMPDPAFRTTGFSVQLDQIARDLVVMSGDRDMRFNVRPEALGQVSVTIGRGDDGPTLRLGVENQAAMQAARAAEPMLTDGSARNGTPFAQVTVDMSAHDQRGRSARAAVLLKRGQAAEADNNIQRAPVKTGRFA